MHLALGKSLEETLRTLAVLLGAELWGLATGRLEDTLELLADVLDTSSA